MQAFCGKVQINSGERGGWVLFLGAVPDNHAMNRVTHCFSCVCCSLWFGVLKRHSHSLRKRGKLCFGMPLNRRR